MIGVLTFYPPSTSWQRREDQMSSYTGGTRSRTEQLEGPPSPSPFPRALLSWLDTHFHTLSQAMLLFQVFTSGRDARMACQNDLRASQDSSRTLQTLHVNRCAFILTVCSTSSVLQNTSHSTFLLVLPLHVSGKKRFTCSWSFLP